MAAETLRAARSGTRRSPLRHAADGGTASVQMRSTSVVYDGRSSRPSGTPTTDVHTLANEPRRHASTHTAQLGPRSSTSTCATRTFGSTTARFPPTKRSQPTATVPRDRPQIRGGSTTATRNEHHAIPGQLEEGFRRRRRGRAAARTVRDLVARTVGAALGAVGFRLARGSSGP